VEPEKVKFLEAPAPKVEAPPKVDNSIFENEIKGLKQKLELLQK
jgi:hypothetical protein